MLNRNARPTPRSEPGECRLRFSLQLGHRLKSARRLTDFTIRSRGRAKSKSGAPADRAAGCIDRARREIRRTTCFLKVIPGRPVATNLPAQARAGQPRRLRDAVAAFFAYFFYMKTLFLSGAVKSLPTRRIDILKSQRHLLSLSHGQRRRAQTIARRTSRTPRARSGLIGKPEGDDSGAYLAAAADPRRISRQAPALVPTPSFRAPPAVPRRREYAERKANMRAERRLSKNFAFPAYNSFPTYN